MTAPTPSTSFLELLQRRERGKLKVYIGSAAGVGKTYRMLQEAYTLRSRGVDVVVGYVETHGRIETEQQVGDLEVIPRKQTVYRMVTLEEMDVDAVIARGPTVALVDELAHTNVPGSKNAKRWEDVQDILGAGISVITAVNVQHLESLNDVIAGTLGVVVRETVPDWVVTHADEVVNLDISADDLRQRLLEGKIYSGDKIPSALSNFFTPENLTTLRELALREVASNVDRLREGIALYEQPATQRSVRRQAKRASDRIMVAMSSNPPFTSALLRKASRIAGRLNTDWYCVYVQTPVESSHRIDTAVQRHLVQNIQKAQEMGAEVVTIPGVDIVETLLDFAARQNVTLLVVGQSRRSWFQHMTRGSIIDRLVNNSREIDVLVVAVNEHRTQSGS